MRSISGWSSGSPPAIETIGAPHSSIAASLSRPASAAEDLGGVLDLAAAGAGEVAREQRLQLDDQRELVATGPLLLQQVLPDREGSGAVGWAS